MHHQGDEINMCIQISSAKLRVSHFRVFVQCVRLIPCVASLNTCSFNIESGWINHHID